MSNLKLAFCVTATSLLLTANSSAKGASAAYTPTEGKACVTISHDRETGDTVSRCPGIAGYSVLVLNSDDRASISIETPDKTVLPLNFWDTITPTFSTLGPKVEWQMEAAKGRRTPVAIIARVRTVDQTDVASPKPLSYLVVAHIRGDKTCVTGKIPGSQANANQAARALANSREPECLPKLR